MAQLPPARVVNKKRLARWPDSPLLAEPPRRVPAVLWIRIMFGGMAVQLTWFAAVFVLLPAAIIVASNDVPQQWHDMRPMWFVYGTAIGLTPFLIICAWFARRRLQLLRYGRETVGKLVRRYEIPAGDAGTRWEYTFEYRLEGGSQQEVTIQSAYRQPRLEDDALEPMVYDPTGTLPATPLDHLPGEPAIDDDGQLIARKPMFLHVLIFPALTLISAASIVVTSLLQ